MKSQDLIELTVRATIPTSSGCAVFLEGRQGKQAKVFIIYVDVGVGEALSMALQGMHKERPLTHDLIISIFKASGILLEQVIINDENDGTFYARLALHMENELGTKLIEIDARPSDCMILALRLGRPIYATAAVFEAVEDMSAVFERLVKERAGK